MSYAAHAATLRANLDKLSPGDVGFATSLLTSVDRGRTISPKMGHWLKVLADRAIAPKPKPIKVEIDGILKLFGKAGEHLKYPKVTLPTLATGYIRLSLAGEAAKFPGSITIVSTERDHEGRNKWLGRIKRDGEVDIKWGLSHDEKGDIVETLHGFAKDPEAFASASGKLTGNCCFCARPLSDKRSTEVGYGPTCAKRWGLHW